MTYTSILRGCKTNNNKEKTNPPEKAYMHMRVSNLAWARWHILPGNTPIAHVSKVTYIFRRCIARRTLLYRMYYNDGSSRDTPPFSYMWRGRSPSHTHTHTHRTDALLHSLLYSFELRAFFFFFFFDPLTQFKLCVCVYVMLTEM